MAIDYERLGRRIKRQRASMRITQAALAEQCEISNVYISHIETGIARPSLDVLFAIAEKLQVTPDSLLMDSLYHSTEHIRDDIADKLQRCTPESMHLISRLIDGVLENQQG